MASKEIEKGSAEWQIFTDFWNLYKKYGTIEPDNEAYWHDLIKGAGAFHRKHNTSLSRHLAIALTSSLQDEDIKLKNK